MAFYRNYQKEVNLNLANPHSEFYFDDFLVDWEKCRVRHSGQELLLDAFIEDEAQYIFNRAGRKFAKTTTNIDIAWYYANEKPNRVIYMCYPTITLGIEVVWDEKRLQWCDLKDDRMFSKYVKKTDDSKHIMWFVNGSYIKLIGTWTEARGRGTQPDLLIVDEVQDCSGDYLDAMDPNLASKDGRCIMSGTPPKKRNHYQEWEERIRNNKRGRCFHFTSYANDKIPHLKEWLDNKKNELIRSGKEDVWVREYLAEDCFSSADRVLPDAKFISIEELQQQIQQYHYTDRTPVMATTTQGKHFCTVFGVLIARQKLFLFDCVLHNQIWDKSYSSMHPQLADKMKQTQDLCGKKMRKPLWDPSDSLRDVIQGYTDCRKDFKWQDRGIPLLKEMMLDNKLIISENLADFGLECQNLLMDENKKEVEKSYPFVATLAMTVNEFFAREKVKVETDPKWDKYAAFKEMGIPYTPKKKRSFWF